MWKAQILPLEAALPNLRAGDLAPARLDGLGNLDGIGPYMLALRLLERRGARLFNGPEALRAAHDQMFPDAQLARAGLPHPRTVQLIGNDAPVQVEPPVVLKPRFGGGSAT